MIRDAVLNIAAGKSNPIELPKGEYFLVNLDLNYFRHTPPDEIEKFYHTGTRDAKFRCNYDAFEFLEKTIIQFNLITCYRFLEHVDKEKVLYFIYLMAETLKVGGEVDIIVPDYKKLAKMIMSEEPGMPGWEAHDIIVTTEVVNHSTEPHASIWTMDRLPYYFELEERFKTISNEPYTFDGRDIYIRYKAKRIK